MTYKRRYKNLDFNPPFLGILADNPRKIANISRLEAVDAIPIDLNQFCPFLVKIAVVKLPRGKGFEDFKGLNILNA